MSDNREIPPPPPPPSATPEDAGDTADVVGAPHKTSLLRSSMVMASGTLVSRILGFLRNFLLLAAIGTGAGSVSAAFGVANNLPNTVYNLLAAGVFDAVLVPQIVRALRSRSGNVYVNRLITLAGTILFGVTLIAMVAAPLLVTLFAKGYSGELRSLSIAFTLLCLPQIFFYGIYNLLGELLNARGIFGPYMWAPVVNNVVGITGLVAFLVMWGPAPGDGVFPVGDFSSPQFWLLAGSATLGVLLQALVLLIPMRNAGVSLRLDFHFRGTSFGTASKVAGWTFATLGVSQIGILSTSNLATQVDTWAAGKDVLLAGIASYTTAFMIYMVPQSLISVSLATAIFTRLANAAAERDGQTMADNYHQGVRLITLLSLLAAAVLMAGAVPMMQLALPPGASPEAARAYSWVLLALMPGVASTGMVLMSQRVFFALEDARPVFLMGIAPTFVQVAVGWSIFALAGPEWWTAGAALGETVCRLLQGFIAVFWVAREIREVNPGRIIASYLKFLAAAVVSFLVGLGVISLLGPVSDPASRLVRYLMAGGKLLVVAILVTAVYVLVLRLIDPSDAGRVLPDLARRLPLPAALRRAVAGRPTGGDWDNGLTQDGRATEGAMERDQDGTDHDGQQEAVGNSDSPLVPGSRPETSSTPPDTGHAADADAGSQDADARTWSAMGTAWSASDPTNTGEFPVISRLTAGRVTPAGRADLPSFDEILRPRGSEASDEGDAGAPPEHEGAGARHMPGGTPDVDPDNQHLTDSLPGDAVGIDESPEGRDRGEDAPLPHLSADLGPSVAPDPEGTTPGDAPTSPATGSEATSAHWIADLGAEDVEEAEGTRPATGASSPGPDSLPAPPPPGAPFDPASFPTAPAGIDEGGPQLLPETDGGDLASPPHPGTEGGSSASVVDAAQTSGANPESTQVTHPHWLHPDAPEDGNPTAGDTDDAQSPRDADHVLEDTARAADSDHAADAQEGDGDLSTSGIAPGATTPPSPAAAPHALGWIDETSTPEAATAGATTMRSFSTWLSRTSRSLRDSTTGFFDHRPELPDTAGQDSTGVPTQDAVGTSHTPQLPPSTEETALHAERTPDRPTGSDHNDGQDSATQDTELLMPPPVPGGSFPAVGGAGRGNTGSTEAAPSPSGPPPTGGSTPKKSGSRLDPTVPALVFALVLVLGGGLWGVRTALAPIGDLDLPTLPSQSGEQSGAQSGEQSGATGGSTEPPAPVTTPQIATPTIFSWRDDGGDNPDSVVNMIDGDPSTEWHSRSYDLNQFREEQTVTILLTLKEKATVSSIDLTMAPETNGGEVVVRNVTDPANPRSGTELATSSLSPQTTITLSQPTEVTALSLSFRTMPTGPNGENWAWIYELAVK